MSVCTGVLLDQGMSFGVLLNSVIQFEHLLNNQLGVTKSQSNMSVFQTTKFSSIIFSRHWKLTFKMK